MYLNYWNEFNGLINSSINPPYEVAFYLGKKARILQKCVQCKKFVLYKIWGFCKRTYKPIYGKSKLSERSCIYFVFSGLTGV